jgi:hypothetical protein
LEVTVETIFQGLSPNDISISPNHRMGSTQVQCFVWIEARVNATEDDPSAALSRLLANSVTAKGVRGVNSNPYDVPFLDLGEVHLL